MGDVVFLAHRNEGGGTSTDSIEVLSCKTCANKTYTAVYEASGNGFPRLKCAFCGQDAGLFGWVSDQ